MRSLHAALAVSALALAGASADDATDAAMSAHDFAFHAQGTALYTPEGEPWEGPVFEEGQTVSLSDYAGHPILVVNTAAHCGYTPQFEALEAMWEEYNDDGLMMIGVHQNNFADQGGSEEELAEQCGIYSVQFPQMQAVDVIGENSDPFYAWVRANADIEQLRALRQDFYENLARRIPNFEIPEITDEELRVAGFPSWNFNKVLIDADGEVIGIFNSGHDTSQVQPELIEAVEAALASS